MRFKRCHLVVVLLLLCIVQTVRAQSYTSEMTWAMFVDVLHITGVENQGLEISFENIRIKPFSLGVSIFSSQTNAIDVQDIAFYINFTRSIREYSSSYFGVAAHIFSEQYISETCDQLYEAKYFSAYYGYRWTGRFSHKWRTKAEIGLNNSEQERRDYCNERSVQPDAMELGVKVGFTF